MNQDESVVLRKEIERNAIIVKFMLPAGIDRFVSKPTSFLEICVTFWFVLTVMLIFIPAMIEASLSNRRGKEPILFSCVGRTVETCLAPGCGERKTIADHFKNEPIHVVCPTCGYYTYENGTVTYL